MATVMMLRHGQTAANATGVLAGRSAGVALDETGVRQAAAVGEWMRSITVADVVSSPMQRCVQTAHAATGHEPRIDDELIECDYGDWTGKTIADLQKDPMWTAVRSRPSAVVFPGGESLREVSHRVVTAVRDNDARVAAEHGDEARWVAVTHGDIIKCVVADALGMHLDLFQRIMIDTCSVTTISYTESGPFALGVNVRDRSVQNVRLEE